MRRFALLLAPLLAAGTATAHEPGAKDALLATDLAWSAAASEGKDVEKVVSYWSDDAVVVPPGMPPIVGKDAIRAFVAHSFATPGFSISWTPVDVVVSDDGTMGYSTAHNTMTMPGPDGTPVTSHGRALAVWRRAPDGRWECVYDIWNAAP